MAEQTVPYKYYQYDVNGKTYYDTLASTNTPTGYKEIDYGTFEQGAKQQYEPAWYGAGKSYYDFLSSNPNLKNALTGGPSQYVINPETGQQQLASQLEAKKAEEAGIASGALQKVAVGSGYGTVPTNSAAAQQIANPALGNVATNGAQGFGPGLAMPTGEAAKSTFDPVTGQQTGAQAGQAAFQAAKASGQPAPQSGGEARVGMAAFTPPAGPNYTGIEQQLAEDPGYQQLLADRAEYTNVVNQTKSLTQEYEGLIKKMGIEAMNTELLNSQKIIDGTEDDIRNEVQAAGGFATDSQVLAMSYARNKQLIKNYNNLLNAKQMAMEQVNNMVNLASQDRNFALAAIEQKMNINQQLTQYRDKFVQNAKEGYQNIINAVGYGGLYDMLQSDPRALALAERTLGMGSGQLETISGYIRNKANLQKFADYTISSPYVVDADGRTVVDTNTGYAYTSEPDFEARTGMTIAEANKKGLIKPLGMTTAAQQQQFENQIDLQKLGLEKQRVGLEGARVSLARQELAAKQQAENLNKVYDIIKNSPKGWGEAAAKIEAEMGKIETGSAIDRILHAHYEGGTPADTMSRSTSQSKINDIDNLLTNNSGLNSSVGPNWASRVAVADAFGSKDNFISGVEQLRTQLTLENLIRAKAEGATFGALSDAELQLLASSASRLGTWAIKDKNGKVTGYDAKESDFKAELDKINNFAKLDYVLKGGDPASVGVWKDPSGEWMTRNSDGSAIIFDELRGL